MRTNSWVYFLFQSSASAVDREEYLLGRSVDKSLDQLNAEEKEKQTGVTQPKNHVEHECIPPSIRDYKQQLGDQVLRQLRGKWSKSKNQRISCLNVRKVYKIDQKYKVDLAAKLQEDPLVAIRKREEESRRQFLQNPIQLKKLQKALKNKSTSKKKKKKKRKSKDSDSDEDLDTKLATKLKALKDNPLGLGIPTKNDKNASKEEDLDTVLIHKFNMLKNKLTKNDLKDILNGKCSDSDEFDTDGSDSR